MSSDTLLDIELLTMLDVIAGLVSGASHWTGGPPALSALVLLVNLVIMPKIYHKIIYGRTFTQILARWKTRRRLACGGSTAKPSSWQWSSSSRLSPLRSSFTGRGRVALQRLLREHVICGRFAAAPVGSYGQSRRCSSCRASDAGRLLRDHAPLGGPARRPLTRCPQIATLGLDRTSASVADV